MEPNRSIKKKEKEMKLFKSIRQNFALLGIDLDQSHQKHRFFSGKILIVYSCYWLNIISYCVFLRREAHNFSEYMEVIFRIFLPIVITTCFTVIVFKVENLFELFESCERIVNKSKLAFAKRSIKKL